MLLLVQQKQSVSLADDLKLSSNHMKEVKMTLMVFHSAYPNLYQFNTLSIKVTTEALYYYFCCTKLSKSGLYLTLRAYLSSDAQFATVKVEWGPAKTTGGCQTEKPFYIASVFKFKLIPIKPSGQSSPSATPAARGAPGGHLQLLGGAALDQAPSWGSSGLTASCRLPGIGDPHLLQQLRLHVVTFLLLISLPPPSLKL